MDIIVQEKYSIMVSLNQKTQTQFHKWLKKMNEICDQS